MTHHKAWPKKEFPKPWMSKKHRPAKVHPVTDHALVRYMERVMMIDVEKLRGHLIDEGRAEMIRAIGTGHLHMPDGATLVVLDGKVVSVLRTDEMKQGARVRRP